MHINAATVDYLCRRERIAHAMKLVGLALGGGAFLVSSTGAHAQMSPANQAKATEGEVVDSEISQPTAAMGSASDQRLAEIGELPERYQLASTPSTATSTVSASTVPQTFSNMNDEIGLSVSLGSVYAAGDFGAARDTSIISTALGLRYAIGNWRLTASIPYVRISSTGMFFTGIDSTPIAVATNFSPDRRVKDGISDLTLGVAYSISPDDGRTEFELSGRIKLPTASDSSQLSSGNTDYSVGFEVTRSFEQISVFGSATYRFFGDPKEWDLRDGIALSAGLGVPLNEKSLLLTSYHFAQAASKFVGDSHELFLGASTLIGDIPLRLSAFGTLGLSHGAPDTSAGLALSYGF